MIALSRSIFLMLHGAIRCERLIGVNVISPFNAKTGKTPEFSAAVSQQWTEKSGYSRVNFHIIFVDYFVTLLLFVLVDG